MSHNLTQSNQYKLQIGSLLKHKYHETYGILLDKNRILRLRTKEIDITESPWHYSNDEHILQYWHVLS